MSDGTQYTDIHNGVDIIGDKKLLAIKDGVVFFKTLDDGTGCKTLVLKHDYHGKRLLVLYAHCNDIYVEVGELVSKGQNVAEMGCTGRVSGVHLHCSMYIVPDDWKWSYKERSLYEINPNDILRLY